MPRIQAKGFQDLSSYPCLIALQEISMFLVFFSTFFFKNSLTCVRVWVNGLVHFILASKYNKIFKLYLIILSYLILIIIFRVSNCNIIFIIINIST